MARNMNEVSGVDAPGDGGARRGRSGDQGGPIAEMPGGALGLDRRKTQIAWGRWTMALRSNTAASKGANTVVVGKYCSE
jgi:hypothetical protein